MFCKQMAAICASMNRSEECTLDFTYDPRAVQRRPAWLQDAEQPCYAGVPAIRALADTRADLPRAPVTFLTGENGSGKLTLPGAITYVKNAKKYNTDDKKDVHVVDRIFM